MTGTSAPSFASCIQCARWTLSTVLLLLTACAPRASRAPVATPSAANQTSYIDLEAGWRLHIVFPITRSGKYTVESSTTQQNGNTLTLSPSSDFIGYESDVYSVKARGRDGILIHFESASETKDGVTNQIANPRLTLFQLPRHAKYVRLLFLRRESQTDHDMAVLAAGHKELLASLTIRVQADPRECRDASRSYCSWIPAGVAVRPERQQMKDGSETWLPVR